MANKSKKQIKKWSQSEDDILMRQVKAYPQNLAKCFLMVAQQTKRSKGAVASRWYTKVSKDPKNVAFFTASSKHVSKNRKNGAGVASNYSIWRKLLSVLKLIK
jgi:hypothetical protein